MHRFVFFVNEILIFSELFPIFTVIRSIKKKTDSKNKNGIAIASADTVQNRVIAAQAADELLNISGISASFVLYPDEDKVIISARSIGTANAQMILEPLGGGGNAATAGAQLRGTTVKDALDQLVASIDAYYEA